MTILLMLPEVRTLVTMVAHHNDPDTPYRLPAYIDNLIYDAATSIMESLLTDPIEDLHYDVALIEYALLAIAKIKHVLNAVVLESLKILDRYGNIAVTVY